MFHLLCAHPFGIVPLQERQEASRLPGKHHMCRRCSQPRDALSRGLLEFLSGAILRPVPEFTKGCAEMPNPRHYRSFQNADNGRRTDATSEGALLSDVGKQALCCQSFGRSFHQEGRARPPRLDKARVACVVLRVLMRLHPRKINPPLVTISSPGTVTLKCRPRPSRYRSSRFGDAMQRHSSSDVEAFCSQTECEAQSLGRWGVCKSFGVEGLCLVQDKSTIDFKVLCLPLLLQTHLVPMIFFLRARGTPRQTPSGTEAVISSDSHNGFRWCTCP